jgi:dephospho-CoA kinase
VKSPIQIGITGGIGSGKSLVSKVFHCLGIPVYDADSRAKNIMTTDGILISQIKKEFGALSYHADGSLNRSLIGESVFNNPERLEVLNRLVHPRVGEDYKRWVNAHNTSPYVLKEAALLFESNSFIGLDKIIVVNAPKDLRIQRVLKRDPQRTERQVRDIIKNQMAEEEKVKRADFLIVNDERGMIIPQVLKIHNDILGSEK